MHMQRKQKLIPLILQANAVDIPLADESVHCCITSPAYWGLRDYGLPPRIWDADSSCKHIWDIQSTKLKVSQGAFCQVCGAWSGCFGLEPTMELYIKHLVQIFREVWRVLRPEGTVFLNLGDSYTSGNRATRDPALVSATSGYANRAAGVYRAKTPAGLKPKDLCGIPWRCAFALQADGWFLRRDIIWAKGVSGQKAIETQVAKACEAAGVNPTKVLEHLDLYVGNPMPESVRDRPASSHEYVFLLTKQKKYFFDAVAIKEPSKYPKDNRKARSHRGQKRMPTEQVAGVRPGSAVYPMRNCRSVWIVPTRGYKGAHFAVYPEKLIEPMIKAGTSERGNCPKCGAPWERVKQTSDWQPTCACNAGEPLPCVVLDPFGGSGTTAVVATRLGRQCISMDLSIEYLNLHKERLAKEKNK